MARSRSMTPEGRRKSEVAAALKARGHSSHNIWLIRPPFEDHDLVLGSDVAMELFYFIEGEPSFLTITYPAASGRSSVGSNAEDLVSEPFARVVRSDGNIAVVQQLTHDRSDSWGPPSDEPYRLHIDVDTLNSAAQRIENWRRIVPCIRRVRMHATATLERLVVMHVERQGSTTIGSLINRLSEYHKALVIGALATVLRRREISADVDTQPWSPMTLLKGEHA